MPETGEEIYSSFLGLPIQRLGDTLGVLVVQSKQARQFSDDEVYALEVVAMVLAEMNELGAFVGEDSAFGLHTHPVLFRGTTGQEGVAEGKVYLHEPRVVVTNPVADDPDVETQRLNEAVDTLRISVDDMLSHLEPGEKDQREVLETYRMFANSRGWMRRMEADITRGLSAEAAVEKEQSVARTRLSSSSDPYMRERLHDLDDLSNRLLRILTGQGHETGAEMPENAVLIARNIGPGELLDYGKNLSGIVLEQGSVGSHAAVVARAWAIPLVIHADRITTEALNGDHILIDGDQGIVHLRPEENVARAFREKNRDAGTGGGTLRRACRPAHRHHLWQAYPVAHERRSDGRSAVPDLVGGRGRGAVSHRVTVPDSQQSPTPGRACVPVRARHGRRPRQARGLSHA